MDVEFVGQYHSFGQDSSDFQISVHSYRNSSFCVCVSYYGDSSVRLYELQYLNEVNNGQSDAKRRKRFDSTSKHYSYGNNYKLSFLELHVLPFPIHFLVSAEGSIWAISHNAYAEMTFGALEDSCNTQVEVSLESSVNANSHVFVGGGGYKRSSICHVSKFSSGILVCRENFLQNCWTVEVIRRGKKPVVLFSIPFASSHISDNGYNHGPEFSYMPPRGAYFGSKHVPVVSCIEAETKLNQGMENVLKKDKFEALFGCSLSSNAVVLVGSPDGNVLWQFMELSAAHSIGHEQRKFHLLCNIEQPVHHISTQSFVRTDETSSITVIGAYGKVMILSPEVTLNYCAAEITATSPFEVSVSHIPSPVYEVAVCHQGVLHTSSHGQLWVSNFSNEDASSSNMLRETHIILNSQQLSYYGVKHIMVLNHQKGLVMCVESNGNVHVGNFFGTKTAADQGITEEEVPLLLKSISVYGSQLQELQVLAQRQRKLFSAVAVAAKIKFQDDHKLSISCKIIEVFPDVRKFLIMVEFHNLQCFNLDHDLWTLNGSVSSAHDERIILSQVTPLNHGSSCIAIETDLTLFVNSVFPVLVEGGLLLDIPAEWKSLGCFENAVTNLPLYVKIQAIMVNEFCIMKHNDCLKWSEVSMNQFEQCKYKTIFTAFHKIAETKSSYIYFKTGLAVNSCNHYNLPQEFSIPILVSSALSIQNDGVCSPTEGHDLMKKLFHYLVRSNITVHTTTDNFVCLNNPLSVSVKRRGDLMCVTLHSSSFPLLVGLKMSLIHLLKLSFGEPESCQKHDIAKQLNMFPEVAFQKYFDVLLHKIFTATCVEEGNHTESSEKNISMSSTLRGTLQVLSIEICRLLCQQRHYVIQEDLEVYKKLREDISSNLHIL